MFYSIPQVELRTSLFLISVLRIHVCMYSVNAATALAGGVSTLLYKWLRYINRILITKTGTIRFWKMSRTFTGLKLQGSIGKFGRKELSDIDGYIELPTGNVLSGCEWGNMLVWEGGLLKVEITRSNRKPCHPGGIQQILLDEGELLTVGIDGYVRVSGALFICGLSICKNVLQVYCISP